MNLQMVDLKGQYQNIKQEVDAAIMQVIESSAFINGPQVKQFSDNLEQYLAAKHVVTCGNGTDALQIALMALGLQPGDEVIVPCFTYVATAEVIALLQLTPVMTEVDPDTFNLTAAIFEKAITAKTKAVVPVHLFGQCVDMEPLLEIARKHNIFVIEDAAQAIGADYTFSDGTVKKAGTMGHIGCTSFFPSKNLGCYGDGGALFTNDADLFRKIKMIANHGQAVKYYHEMVGVNSRLDTIQAVVLDIKLKRLDAYAKARNEVAAFYDKAFSDLDWISSPSRQHNSTHVFHQYTLKLTDPADRDKLKAHLEAQKVPAMVYYPVALHLQNAFRNPKYGVGDFPVSETLCSQVISLPIHTEMTNEQLVFITEALLSFKKEAVPALS